MVSPVQLGTTQTKDEQMSSKQQQQSRDSLPRDRASVLARKLERSRKVSARRRLAEMVDREHRAEMAEVPR